MSAGELARKLPGRVRRAALLSNGPGAIVTALFLLFLAPSVDVDDPARTAVLNAAVFVPYLAATLWLGTRFSQRRYLAPIVDWLRAGRPATEAERELVLRYPLVPGVAVSAFFWGAAAVLFAAINVAETGEFALVVAATILLGGVTTCAVIYLFVERLFRPVTALALASGPPAHPVTPGISARVTMAWTAASGVPLLGVLALAAATLAGAADEQSLAGSAALVAAVGLAVGLFAMVLAARSLADPIASVRHAMMRLERGELGTRVPVDDGSEVGLLEAGFNRMAAGLEERERMRDLFGRHVGRDVAAAALEGEFELGGEERELAALFVDLVGSTALAAQRPATEVVSLLNEFFRVVVEVTEANGGFVNKFEGDAALCVFGAPVSRPDPAGGALAAAREMRERLRREVPQLDLGIGVSAGLAVAGNVGAEERFEYTVIGDPVNEAARLCELAKQRAERVLASAAALEAASAEERPRWALGEAVTVRGRDAQTRLATPT